LRAPNAKRLIRSSQRDVAAKQVWLTGAESGNFLCVSLLAKMTDAKTEAKDKPIDFSDDKVPETDEFGPCELTSANNALPYDHQVKASWKELADGKGDGKW
jgi:hypothetical protein